MRAYNSTEADQTDSITVVASRDEWESIIDFLFVHAPDALTADTDAWQLIGNVSKVMIP